MKGFETVGDVLHRILENARRDPDHVAIKDTDSELTYVQLTNQTARVAAAMVARGVVSGDRVVLLLQNSIDFVISALASLWIGAIFVPLDATDPMQRLVTLMKDCRPAIVITNGVMDEAALPEDFVKSLLVNVLQLQNDRADIVGVLPGGERPSYMIYTSGTTGTPKGVVIGSGAFEAAVMSCCEVRDLGPSTRTLSVSPFHFDGSFATLFTTLACGGALIIRPRESLLFPRVFFNTIIAESVTYTGFTPSYLRVLESGPQFDTLGASDLKIIALGGEAFSVGDLEAIWAVAPEVRIFNGYGPTETTITASHMEMNRAAVARGAIPIGKPNPGVQFYLLDNLGQIIQESLVAGELYIGGCQLMDGYWESPELTEKVFRSDIVVGQRLYQTGDIAYLDTEGNYVYVNRADRVIKRGGVRISLLEIAEAFRRNDEVRMATSIAFDNDGNLGIATFLVVNSEISHIELHRRVQEFLPSSMLPDRIEIVESIPLTSSGKTDERRLLSDVGLSPWVFTDSIQK